MFELVIVGIAFVIFLVVGVLLTLSPSEPAPDTPPAPSAEAQRALAMRNAEMEFERNLLSELQKQDASVFDAYYSTDAIGNKTITIAREASNGLVETVSASASEVERWKEAAQKQEGTQLAEAPTQESTQSASSGGSIVPGLLMGYIASQMLSSSGSATAMHDSRAAFSSHRSEAVSRYTRSLSPALSSINRAGSSFTGSTSRGSFSSSGARAGGYASGG